VTHACRLPACTGHHFPERERGKSGKIPSGSTPHHRGHNPAQARPFPGWPGCPPPTGPPRYDYELIAALEALIAESETGWRQLYNELRLTPYQVVYEELSSPDGYEQTIRGVLAHLGLADYQGPIPAPQTRRQSNDLNEAWVAAYLADMTSRQEH